MTRSWQCSRVPNTPGLGGRPRSAKAGSASQRAAASATVRPIDTGSRTATPRLAGSRPARANASRRPGPARPPGRRRRRPPARRRPPRPARPAARGRGARGRPPRPPGWASAGRPRTRPEPVGLGWASPSRVSSRRSAGSPSRAGSGSPPARMAPSRALATSGPGRAAGPAGDLPGVALSSIQIAPILARSPSAPPRPGARPGSGRRARRRGAPDVRVGRASAGRQPWARL